MIGLDQVLKTQAIYVKKLPMFLPMVSTAIIIMLSSTKYVPVVS